MELIVHAGGTAEWRGRLMRCALGRGGVSTAKREGDGATPVGRLPMRRALYRPDREAPPATALACAPIAPTNGWCDDPADAAYNTAVRLPHAGGHERLWRDDRVYDLVVVLGWNDDPPVPGRGSAIFLHLARDGYAPTEGCVALARADMLALLAEARPGDAVRVLPLATG
jgi:L,D-peptidoglycan transpeptidase YkuD (ErfK/YbiS/YcfS/YnhG family)